MTDVIGIIFALLATAFVAWMEGNSRGWQQGFSEGCELHRDLDRRYGTKTPAAAVPSKSPSKRAGSRGKGRK